MKDKNIEKKRAAFILILAAIVIIWALVMFS